jgi:hypothetical protein
MAVAESGAPDKFKDLKKEADSQCFSNVSYPPSAKNQTSPFS